jgi:hypothetical protein
VDSEAPGTKPWLEKYYTVNEGWVSEDRRKLLAAAERKPFDKAPAQWLAASAMTAGTK